VIGVPLAAWAASRLEARLRLVAEFATVAAIVYGLHESVSVGAKDVVVTAVALTALIGLLRLATKLPRRLVPAAAVAAAAVVLLAGYEQQKQLNDNRWKGEPVLVAVTKFAPSGYRIGVAGEPALSDTVPVYPMFGPRLRNKVQWIGPLVRGVLRDWPTRAGFRGAVQRSKFDLIVIERGSPARAQVKQQDWLAGLGYKQVAQSRALTLYRRGA
jgi:hypothetical protein